MPRPRSLVLRAALAAGVVVSCATGCASLTSPATISTPYQAADGVSLDLNDPSTDATVRLRDMVVIGNGDGAPGELIGAIVNDGNDTVQVSLTADTGQDGPLGETLITVRPRSMVRLGPDADARITLQRVPVAPGALLAMSIKTGSSGGYDLKVPVLPPQGAYTGITPTTSPATPTGTPSATAPTTPPPTTP